MRAMFTLILFLAMMVSLPSVYFAFVVAGLEPAVVYWGDFFFTYNHDSFTLFFATLWTVVYFVVAVIVTRRVFSRSVKPPLVVMFGAPVVLFACSFLPIYSPVSHGGQEHLNIVGETRSLINQCHIREWERLRWRGLKFTEVGCRPWFLE